MVYHFFANFMLIKNHLHTYSKNHNFDRKSRKYTTNDYFPIYSKFKYTLTVYLFFENCMQNKIVDNMIYSKINNLAVNT